MGVQLINPIIVYKDTTGMTNHMMTDIAYLIIHHLSSQAGAGYKEFHCNKITTGV